MEKTQKPTVLESGTCIYLSSLLFPSFLMHFCLHVTLELCMYIYILNVHPHNKGVFGGDDDTNFVVVDFFIIVSIIVVMKLAFKIGNQYQKKDSIKAVGYARYKRHSKQ